MFHYVFLDPQTIKEASDAGEMGLGRLIELLNGFRRDVIIADTDAWRFDDEIRNVVHSIPQQAERKMIGDLLVSLKQSGPLLLLEGDNDVEVSLVDFARLRASLFDLDLILSPGEIEKPAGENWVKASLSNLHLSDFATRRYGLMSGRRYKQGEKSFAQVGEDCFTKLVRHADTVKVYDYALGKFYSNDQPVNLKRLVRFLRDHARHLRILEIYTLSTARKAIQNDISDLQHEVDFKIKLELREHEHELPHPRYLGADKRYLDIDRGIDLCDAHDRCRLIQIKYASCPVM